METQHVKPVFRERIRELRVLKGMSLQDVASILGFDRTYLFKLEKGLECPSAKTLKKIISFYGISESDAIEWLNPGRVISVQFRKGGSIPEDHALVNSFDLRKEVSYEFKIMGNITSDNQKVMPPVELHVSVPDGLNTLYSDSVFVTANKYGMVLDFAQGMASTPERKVIARVGMSREHIEALINVLQAKLVEMQALEK